MMRSKAPLHHTWFAALLAALTIACGAGEDERGSLGDPPAAVEYCQALGDAIVGSECRFSDGTTCEEWSFYYGKCGQAHSYCRLHGGQISSTTRDMGTWTAVVAVCTLNGKQCDEDPFFRTGSCP